MSHKTRRLKQRIKELEAQNAKLQELVNPTNTIETILSGIAPLFLGYQQNDDKKHIEVQTAQNLYEQAGVSDGVYFPDVEFDTYMEGPDKWPTEQQQISNGNYRIANGNVFRKDGAPMFEAGTTGPPPESATE